MDSGDFKDLARKTASDKVLRGKVFNIAKNPKYDGYQRGLTSMVYKFFDKKSEVVVITRMQINLLLIMKNQLKNYTNQLLETLKKPSLFKIQRQYLRC